MICFAICLVLRRIQGLWLHCKQGSRATSCIDAILNVFCIIGDIMFSFLGSGSRSALDNLHTVHEQLPIAVLKGDVLSAIRRAVQRGRQWKCEWARKLFLPSHRLTVQLQFPQSSRDETQCYPYRTSTTTTSFR
ncbi:hva22 tb2 dp1 family protein [Moniliophthora roreri]|nr:hva22 tb2 dp1 family protein [Moniliophthora roreri]